MSKKPPKLTLVGADTVANPPPRALGKAGLALWIGVTAENVFEDCAGREMLCAACQALDTAELCAEQIAADGPVIRKGGTVREHPALRAELANRSFVVRTLSRLGLDAEPLRAIGRGPTQSYPIA